MQLPRLQPAINNCQQSTGKNFAPALNPKAGNMKRKKDMAHIIGLTTINGDQIMVNADHIIYWAPVHDGRTIVHMTGDHSIYVREDIHTINQRIDVIQAALETWTDE